MRKRISVIIMIICVALNLMPSLAFTVLAESDGNAVEVSGEDAVSDDQLPDEQMPAPEDDSEPAAENTAEKEAKPEDRSESGDAGGINTVTDKDPVTESSSDDETKADDSGADAIPGDVDEENDSSAEKGKDNIEDPVTEEEAFKESKADCLSYDPLYILRYADSRYVDTSKMDMLMFVDVVTAAKGVATYNEKKQKEFEVTQTNYIAGLNYEIPVYDIDPDSNYYVCIPNVNKFNDNFPAYDLELTYNTDFAEIIDGWHYEKGILYIPKETVDHPDNRHETPNGALLAVQLNYAIGEDMDLSKTIPVQILSKDEPENKTVSVSNLFDADCLSVNTGEKGRSTEDIDVYLNGQLIPITADSWEYERSSGELSIHVCPGVISNINVVFEKRTLTKKAKDLATSAVEALTPSASAAVSMSDMVHFRTYKSKVVVLNDPSVTDNLFVGWRGAYSANHMYGNSNKSKMLKLKGWKSSVSYLYGGYTTMTGAEAEKASDKTYNQKIAVTWAVSSYAAADDLRKGKKDNANSLTSGEKINYWDATAKKYKKKTIYAWMIYYHNKLKKSNSTYGGGKGNGLSGTNNFAFSLPKKIKTTVSGTQMKSLVSSGANKGRENKPIKFTSAQLNADQGKKDDEDNYDYYIAASCNHLAAAAGGDAGNSKSRVYVTCIGLKQPTETAYGYAVMAFVSAPDQKQAACGIYKFRLPKQNEPDFDNLKEQENPAPGTAIPVGYGGKLKYKLSMWEGKSNVPADDCDMIDNCGEGKLIYEDGSAVISRTHGAEYVQSCTWTPVVYEVTEPAEPEEEEEDPDDVEDGFEEEGETDDESEESGEDESYNYTAYKFYLKTKDVPASAAKRPGAGKDQYVYVETHPEFTVNWSFPGWDIDEDPYVDNNGIYTPLYSGFNVEKEVYGEGGDETRGFEYTVSIQAPQGWKDPDSDKADFNTGKIEFINGGEYYDEGTDSWKSGETGFASDPDGKAEFRIRLKHGQKAWIYGIPLLSKYKVTETASDHIPSYTVGTEPFSTAEIPYDPSVNKNEGSGKSGNDLSTEEEVLEAKDGIATITFNNTRIPVIVHKTDKTGNKNELAGAVMRIIDESGAVADSWTSQETAHTIENLDYGSYTLQELSAPYGYDVADDVEFTVDENDKSVEVSMDNQPLTIGTTAADTVTEGRQGRFDSSETITDKVHLTGLYSGRVYRVDGELVDKDTGEVLKDSEGNDLTSDSGEFTANSDVMDVHVNFTVDSSAFKPDTKIVVYEKLIRLSQVHDAEEDTVPAELQKHNDINDTDQTIEYPGIYTSANISDNNKIVSDVVKYSGIIPGRKYIIKGWLVDTSTGDKIPGSDNSYKIRKAASGSGDVTIDYSAKGYSGSSGDRITAFEELYVEGKVNGKTKDILIAEHKDRSNENQTVELNSIQKHRKTPKTGDAGLIVYYAAILLGAAAAVLLIAIRRV